ncbi:hypothetical protein T484DRAFT_1914522 [Baffinella frigidus]|nr:hypothetical protein T484DRAFT_1914522 [Cryptophyta sp. CCMP2293]
MCMLVESLDKVLCEQAEQNAVPSEAALRTKLQVAVNPDDEVLPFSNPEDAPSAPPLRDFPRRLPSIHAIRAPPPLEVPSKTFAALPGRAPPPPYEHDLQVDFSMLDVEADAIAAGSFKSVFRAAWRREGGGAPVTVAVLKLRGPLGGGAEFAREIQVFVKLGRHPHLATLLGVTTHPDGAMCMLVEYALRGSGPQHQP